MRRLVIVAVALLAACSKEAPAPSCEQITDHILAVFEQTYPGHGDMAAANRANDIQNCERRKLSATARRCIVAAKTLDAIAACQPKPAPPPSNTPRSP